MLPARVLRGGQRPGAGAFGGLLGRLHGERSMVAGCCLYHRAVSGHYSSWQLHAAHEVFHQRHAELLAQHFPVPFEEVSDGAVVRLPASTNPPRPHIAHGQVFQIPQRPLPAEHAIDDQSQDRSRMVRFASARLIADQQPRVIDPLQLPAQIHHPLETSRCQVFIETLGPQAQVMRTVVKEPRPAARGRFVATGCSLCTSARQPCPKSGTCVRFRLIRPIPHPPRNR